MKNFIRGMWYGLGTTGRLLLFFFLFYFIAKTLKH